jgi:hypothetical protein
MKITEARVYAVWCGAILVGSMAWASSGERGKLVWHFGKHGGTASELM